MKILTLFSVLLFSVSLFAQEKGLSPIKSTQSQQGKTYAVVIGVSDYQDEDIPDLRFADKDALAFAGFLQSTAGGSLDQDHMKVLINEQATSAQFAISLDWLWEVVEENDKVIIYFSGHGDVEKKSITQPGYLLCWDAPARVYLAGGAMNVRDLNDVVSTLSIQNKAKVILITDACRAGKLSGSGINGSQATAANLTKQFANEIKILSCQPDEYSIEGEQWGGGRGAFSYHLLNGLYGMADKNSDLNVTLTEIGRYLEDHVTVEVDPQNQLPMTIGNGRENLTVVSPEILAEQLKMDNQLVPLFASTDSRGMEDDVLADADTSVVEMYFAFKESITNKKFLEPTETCANFYYEFLSQEPQLERLHSTMRRNYAAALQDDAQQVINKWLKSDISEIVLSKISQTAKYQPYPRYLERAAELLGSRHYMYSILMARKLYFEGYLLSLTHSNPDKVLGAAALEKFKGALLLQPNMPHAYLSMAQVFGHNMLQSDSMKYYALLASDQAPSWLIPATSTAFILSRKYKQFDQAKYYLEKADQIDSNSVLVLNTWGNVFSNARQYDQAEKYYKKAIELDSTFTFVYNNLGGVYQSTQDYGKAEKNYKKAIKLDSTFTIAYNNLGLVFTETKNYIEAEKYFKKALLLDSTYTNVYFSLGVIYNETQRYDEAERCYKKTIQLDSTIIIAYSNLGGVYQNTKRYKEAEKSFKKTVQLDSTNWIAYANLGVLYQFLEEWEESKNATLKSIQLGPPIWELRAMLGNAYTHLPERMEDAKNELDKVVEMSPDSPDTYIYLAQWSLKKKQMVEAWKYLKQGLENGIGNGQLKFHDLQEGPDFAEMRKDVRWEELIEKYFPEENKD